MTREDERRATERYRRKKYNRAHLNRTYRNEVVPGFRKAKHGSGGLISLIAFLLLAFAILAMVMASKDSCQTRNPRAATQCPVVTSP